MDVTVLWSLLLEPGINPGHVWTPSEVVCHNFKATFQVIWMYFQLCCVWGNVRYWKKIVLDWLSIQAQRVFLWKFSMFYSSKERLTNGWANNSSDYFKISVVFKFAFCTADYTTFSRAACCTLTLRLYFSFILVLIPYCGFGFFSPKSRSVSLFWYARPALGSYISKINWRKNYGLMFLLNMHFYHNKDLPVIPFWKRDIRGNDENCSLKKIIALGGGLKKLALKWDIKLNIIQ